VIELAAHGMEAMTVRYSLILKRNQLLTGIQAHVPHAARATSRCAILVLSTASLRMADVSFYPPEPTESRNDWKDAEYCLLRAEAGVRIPTHVRAAEYAPILCAGVTVFNSMRHMNVQPGSTVAIQGLGGLGHLAIQYANRFGFRVVAISRDAQKEKFVRELGAHEYIDTSKEDAATALQKLGGASLIVATAPNPQVISPLLKGLGPLGKILLLAGKPPIGGRRDDIRLTNFSGG